MKSVLMASRHKFLGRFTVYAQQQQEEEEEEEQVPPYISSTCHRLLLPFLFLPIIQSGACVCLCHPADGAYGSRGVVFSCLKKAACKSGDGEPQFWRETGVPAAAPAVVAGDAATACPGTAAVGPQTGQPRGGSPDGGARLGLSFALHPNPPLPAFSIPILCRHPLNPPACGGDRRVQGRLWFPDTVSREEIFSVSREEMPSQFGEKSTKALLPTCRNPNPSPEKTKSPLILLRHSTISCAQS